MAYKGGTRIISCGRGGLTGASVVDVIQPYMMLYNSRNLVYEKGGRRKRGGTAHVYDAAFTGTPRILGVYDCIFENLSQFLIVATDDGDVYSDDETTIATSFGDTLMYSFAMGENKLFIADGVNEPLVWTGTGSAAEIADPAADWGSVPPFQMMVHSKAASLRMCALNATTLYLSKTYAAAGDMEDFDTDAASIRGYTGDGFGFTGMIEIGNQVVVFGKNKAFRLDDDDTSIANWGLMPAQWGGGAATWSLLTKLPSGDVLAMMDDGEIYSISAAATYGDYKQASITKDSWMHDWIKDRVNLAKIGNFHAQYFPKLRAVFYFVTVGSGDENNTALLYFIDRPPEEAWMVHENAAFPSGYNASASGVIKDLTAGSYKLYTGDYDGEIWGLDSVNKHDDSKSYYAGWKTPNDAFDNPRETKMFNKFRLIGSSNGNIAMTIIPTVDGDEKDSFDLSIAGGDFVLLDAFVLDTHSLAEKRYFDETELVGYRGKRIQYEIYNNVANEDFVVTEYHTDYKPYGKKQEQ